MELPERSDNTLPEATQPCNDTSKFFWLRCEDVYTIFINGELTEVSNELLVVSS